MALAPLPLTRHVVILCGYHTPALRAQSIVRALSNATGTPREDFLVVSYVMMANFDAIARYTVGKIEERWPSESAYETQPVDVIGISMGGLVGRYAAIPRERRRLSRDEGFHSDSQPAPASDPSSKRLNMKRLFTFATPHRGATLAQTVAPDSLARDMRSGSAFLGLLDQERHACPFDLVCYVQEHDNVVGAKNAAPPGEEPIWTQGLITANHFTVVDEPRFVADVAHRLTGQPPLLQAGEPPQRN